MVMVVADSRSMTGAEQRSTYSWLADSTNCSVVILFFAPDAMTDSINFCLLIVQAWSVNTARPR